MRQQQRDNTAKILEMKKESAVVNDPEWQSHSKRAGVAVDPPASLPGSSSDAIEIVASIVAEDEVHARPLPSSQRTIFIEDSPTRDLGDQVCAKVYMDETMLT